MDNLNKVAREFGMKINMKKDEDDVHKPNGKESTDNHRLRGSAALL